MIPFTNSPLDRADDRRHDADWIRTQFDAPSTTIYALRDGQPLVRDGALAIVPRTTEPALFLGTRDERAYFAIEPAATFDAASDGATFEDFRTIVPLLSDDQATLASTARSLFEWHRRHRFCSVCGQPSEVAKAGWQRVCRGCSAEHFPRVDPVVIMLPLFGDRCLLGRQGAWPAKRMSALAGFVEPGETIEAACAREVQEEAGLIATHVRYFGSQPWPFPSSLMIGLFAEVANEAAVADGVELEEVRWLTREEARAALDGTHPEVLPPSAIGISRHLIEAWVERRDTIRACV